MLALTGEGNFIHVELNVYVKSKPLYEHDSFRVYPVDSGEGPPNAFKELGSFSRGHASPNYVTEDICQKICAFLPTPVQESS